MLNNATPVLMLPAKSCYGGWACASEKEGSDASSTLSYMITSSVPQLGVLNYATPEPFTPPPQLRFAILMPCIAFRPMGDSPTRHDGKPGTQCEPFENASDAPASI